jgi:PTS system arbutin-like IIC component
MPLYYTPLGGTAEIAGEVYHGAMSIWYATLGNIDQITSIHPSIGYILNFGYTALPVGAALAFIRTAKPENKAKVKAVVWPAVFAAAFAGITEPIEFLFLFVAPVLWLAHALIYGFGLLLSSVLGLGVFVGPVIDTLMGALVVPVSLGKQWLIPIIFVILTAIEYFAFKALIVKLNLKTLGRDTVENGEGMEEVGGASSKRGSILSKESLRYIIEGLGGKDNILEVNNCYTRLRIDVKDESLVNEAILKKSKNQGIIRKGSHIQIVIGMDVPEVKEELVAELAKL